MAMTLKVEMVKTPTLDEMERIVGGDIKFIAIEDGDLIVNKDEFGDNCKEKYNIAASRIAGFPIFGNAILLLEKARIFRHEVY